MTTTAFTDNLRTLAKRARKDNSVSIHELEKFFAHYFEYNDDIEAIADDFNSTYTDLFGYGTYEVPVAQHAELLEKWRDVFRTAGRRLGRRYLVVLELPRHDAPAEVLEVHPVPLE